jgi:hypothetical protein
MEHAWQCSRLRWKMKGRSQLSIVRWQQFSLLCYMALKSGEQRSKGDTARGWLPSSSQGLKLETWKSIRSVQAYTNKTNSKIAGDSSTRKQARPTTTQAAAMTVDIDMVRSITNALNDMDCSNKTCCTTN